MAAIGRWELILRHHAAGGSEMLIAGLAGLEEGAKEAAEPAVISNYPTYFD